MRFEAGAPKHAKHAIKIHRTLLQIEDHIKQNIDPGTYIYLVYTSLIDLKLIGLHEIPGIYRYNDTVYGL